MADQIEGISDLVRSSLSMVSLVKGSKSEKEQLLENLKSWGIIKSTAKSIPASSKEVFETLEEWRVNIKNLVSWIENFGMEKYKNDAKRQSMKFLARTTDIFEGLEEFGEQFDLSRSLVNIRTELKMLDLDRNKIFNLLTELISKVSSLGGSGVSIKMESKSPVRNPKIKSNERDRTMVNQVTLHDGSEYSGQWLNDEPDGEGEREWPHREADSSIKASKYKLRYEGEFQCGRAHGFGKWEFANGDIYEGNWENDEIHGEGTQTNKKGVVLQGTWNNGFLQGNGHEKWPNGDYYEGEFSLSKKHGKGAFNFKDGSSYTGEFKANSINGYGTYLWKDKRKYEGYFKDNKMEGFGKYTWPKGETYEGEYQNDKRHGKGIFRWPDGRVYEGYFIEGKKHGEAEYTDKNRERKRGLWEDGKHVKWLD
jgi:hypothetical protein